MQQKWIKVLGRRLCISVGKKKAGNKVLVIFFPGLGQNKSGSYFIFSQIARDIVDICDTLQIDYYGFGDSEGEIFECSYMDICFQCERILFSEIYKYKKVFIVSSGFANNIAEYFSNCIPKVTSILIEPCMEDISSFQSVKYLKEIADHNQQYIDTSELYEKFEDCEKLFMYLGEGYNRCKGLLCSVLFLCECIKSFEIKRNQLDRYIFTSKNISGPNIFSIGEANILLSPKSRDKMINIIHNIVLKQIYRLEAGRNDL